MAFNGQNWPPGSFYVPTLPSLHGDMIGTQNVNRPGFSFLMPPFVSTTDPTNNIRFPNPQQINVPPSLQLYPKIPVMAVAPIQVDQSSNKDTSNMHMPEYNEPKQTQIQTEQTLPISGLTPTSQPAITTTKPSMFSYQQTLQQPVTRPLMQQSLQQPVTNPFMQPSLLPNMSQSSRKEYKEQPLSRFSGFVNMPQQHVTTTQSVVATRPPMLTSNFQHSVQQQPIIRPLLSLASIKKEHHAEHTPTFSSGLTSSNPPQGITLQRPVPTKQSVETTPHPLSTTSHQSQTQQQPIIHPILSLASIKKERHEESVCTTPAFSQPQISKNQTHLPKAQPQFSNMYTQPQVSKPQPQLPRSQPQHSTHHTITTTIQQQPQIFPLLPQSSIKKEYHAGQTLPNPDLSRTHAATMPLSTPPSRTTVSQSKMSVASSFHLNTSVPSMSTTTQQEPVIRPLLGVAIKKEFLAERTYSGPVIPSPAAVSTHTLTTKSSLVLSTPTVSTTRVMTTTATNQPQIHPLLPLASIKQEYVANKTAGYKLSAPSVAATLSSTTNFQPSSSGQRSQPVSSIMNQQPLYPAYPDANRLTQAMVNIYPDSEAKSRPSQTPRVLAPMRRPAILRHPGPIRPTLRPENQQSTRPVGRGRPRMNNVRARFPTTPNNQGVPVGQIQSAWPSQSSFMTEYPATVTPENELQWEVPKIDTYCSLNLKKQSLFQLMEMLDNGSLRTFVYTSLIPNSYDFHRAEMLHKTAQKFKVTGINSDIPDSFYEGLTSPYISNYDVLQLKEKMTEALKYKCRFNLAFSDKSFQSSTAPSSKTVTSGTNNKDSTGPSDSKNTGWRTEKITNINPKYLQEFCEPEKLEKSLSREKTDEADLIRKAFTLKQMSEKSGTQAPQMTDSLNAKSHTAKQSFVHHQSRASDLSQRAVPNMSSMLFSTNKPLGRGAMSRNFNPAANARHRGYVVNAPGKERRPIMKKLKNLHGATIDLTETADHTETVACLTKHHSVQQIILPKVPVLPAAFKVGENTCNKGVKCYLCDQYEKNDDDIWSHVISKHIGEEGIKAASSKFSCTHCLQEFTSYKDVQTHESSTHLSWSLCFFCGLGINSHRSDSDSPYWQHVIKTHCQLFVCNVCQGNFVTAERFEGHCRSTHHEQPAKGTTQQLYLCPYCNLKYISQRTLRQHILGSHAKDEEQYASCTICKKQLLDQTALDFHKSHLCTRPEKAPEVSAISLVTLAQNIIGRRQASRQITLDLSTRNKKGKIIEKQVVEETEETDEKSDKLKKKIKKGVLSQVRKGNITMDKHSYVFPIEDFSTFCGLDKPSIPSEKHDEVLNYLVKLGLEEYARIQLPMPYKRAYMRKLCLYISRTPQFTDYLEKQGIEPLKNSESILQVMKEIRQLTKVFLKPLQFGDVEHDQKDKEDTNFVNIKPKSSSENNADTLPVVTMSTSQALTNTMTTVQNEPTSALPSVLVPQFNPVQANVVSPLLPQVPVVLPQVMPPVLTPVSQVATMQNVAGIQIMPPLLQMVNPAPVNPPVLAVLQLPCQQNSTEQHCSPPQAQPLSGSINSTKKDIKQNAKKVPKPRCGKFKKRKPKVSNLPKPLEPRKILPRPPDTVNSDSVHSDDTIPGGVVSETVPDDTIPGEVVSETVPDDTIPGGVVLETVPGGAMLEMEPEPVPGCSSWDMSARSNLRRRKQKFYSYAELDDVWFDSDIDDIENDIHDNSDDSWEPKSNVKPVSFQPDTFLQSNSSADVSENYGNKIKRENTEINDNVVKKPKLDLDSADGGCNGKSENVEVKSELTETGKKRRGRKRKCGDSEPVSKGSVEVEDNGDSVRERQMSVAIEKCNDDGEEISESVGSLDRKVLSPGKGIVSPGKAAKMKTVQKHGHKRWCLKVKKKIITDAYAVQSERLCRKILQNYVYLHYYTDVRINCCYVKLERINEANGIKENDRKIEYNDENDKNHVTVRDECNSGTENSVGLVVGRDNPKCNVVNKSELTSSWTEQTSQKDEHAGMKSELLTEKSEYSSEKKAGPITTVKRKRGRPRLKSVDRRKRGRPRLKSADRKANCEKNIKEVNNDSGSQSAKCAKSSELADKEDDNEMDYAPMTPCPETNTGAENGIDNTKPDSNTVEMEKEKDGENRAYGANSNIRLKDTALNEPVPKENMESEMSNDQMMYREIKVEYEHSEDEDTSIEHTTLTIASSIKREAISASVVTMSNMSISTLSPSNAFTQNLSTSVTVSFPDTSGLGQTQLPSCPMKKKPIILSKPTLAQNKTMVPAPEIPQLPSHILVPVSQISGVMNAEHQVVNTSSGQHLLVPVSSGPSAGSNVASSQQGLSSSFPLVQKAPLPVSIQPNVVLPPVQNSLAQGMVQQQGQVLLQGNQNGIMFYQPNIVQQRSDLQGIPVNNQACVQIQPTVPQLGVLQAQSMPSVSSVLVQSTGGVLATLPLQSTIQTMPNLQANVPGNNLSPLAIQPALNTDLNKQSQSAALGTLFLQSPVSQANAGPVTLNSAQSGLLPSNFTTISPIQVDAAANVPVPAHTRPGKKRTESVKKPIRIAPHPAPANTGEIQPMNLKTKPNSQ